jgi:hypothetical protein
MTTKSAPWGLEAELADLPWTQRRMLGALRAVGPVTAAGLAVAADLPPTSVYLALPRLRARHLLTRAWPWLHLEVRVVRWLRELEQPRRNFGGSILSCEPNCFPTPGSRLQGAVRSPT